jgi:outer membrane protein OmpA-like peptidoglycan-associated protein
VRESRLVTAVVLILCSAPQEAWPAEARPATRDVPALYKTTRDQAGHELVKTEDFVVPVGTTVVVKGLEFDGPPCSLSPDQERILRQVFNSIEEITENTLNDTDAARVAKFKAMKFEIRGYSTFAGDQKADRALSEDCANIVVRYLTGDGTPAWRLTAKGLGSRMPAAHRSSTRKLMVDFTRTK